MTYIEFIRSHHLRMVAGRADRNPNMADGRNMDHWRCVIRAGKRQMTLPFSQGYGHGGAEPELSSVLSCLASDAASVENAGDFESWADELGYDPDSRSAERTFKACKRQGRKLRQLLGDTAYETLLWETQE